MRESAFQWRDVNFPSVAVRDPDSDGLELVIRSRTVPEPDYDGTHLAQAQLTTIVRAIETRHENVLLATSDLWDIADLVGRAVDGGDLDRTISIFDDGMTIRIDTTTSGLWSITCRPVPVLPTQAKSTRLSAFTFTIHRQGLERARQQLNEVCRLLHESDLG